MRYSHENEFYRWLTKEAALMRCTDFTIESAMSHAHAMAVYEARSYRA